MNGPTEHSRQQICLLFQIGNWRTIIIIIISDNNNGDNSGTLKLEWGISKIFLKEYMIVF